MARSTQAEMDAAYQVERTRSLELLASLTTGLKLHRESGAKNWGHVGDLRSVNAKLQDLSDMLNHQGEYAR
jgi:hypothetical protein